MMRIRTIAGSLSLVLAVVVSSANAQLENHYTFDDENDIGADSSGNGREAEVEDLGGIEWLIDEARGSGVIQLPGGNADYLFAELPEDGLPADFTIAFWAYRDEDLCCEPDSGANDGFFQVQLDTGGNVSTGEKIVGGWVQKTTDAVWGRVREDDEGFINQYNLDQNTYFMENGVWTHFAYRSTSDDDLAEFEVVVNGESGEGPFLEYNGILDFHDQIIIGRQDTETWGGRLDDFRVYSAALTDEEIKEIMGPATDVGDYNMDGMLDVADLDLQSAEMKKPQAEQDLATYDHNEDMKVDVDDRTIWVKELKGTWIGDSNFDNEFNSGDLVQVFAAGKYETGEMADWGQGDWNGDMEFGSSDLVFAFADGGYEQGPAVAAVPEPSSIGFLLLGLLMIWKRRCR